MNIKEKVLKYLKSCKNSSFVKLSRDLKIPFSKNKELSDILNELQKEYKVFRDNKDNYYAPELIETVVGLLNVSNKGTFGFVDYNINEETGEKDSVFVKNFNFKTAINGDLVQVNVYKNPRDENDQNNGIVTEVLERNTQEIVGFIKKTEKSNTVFFQPIDAKLKNNKFIILPSDVSFKVNDLVAASVVDYKERYIEIKVDKVITNDADPMVFVKAFIEQVKVPEAFPEELKNETDKIPQNIDLEDQSNRVDLTDQMIVTIDGDDTKDFDDAITVKKLPNGNYFLGVYIADVSYYVQEHTEINKEALKRGTSIYLVDRVIPMLPFELSNGICSLNPNEKRFVMAAEMEIDKFGNNVNCKIFQGIIKSKFRLTYKQVDKYFKENTILEDYSNQQEVSELKKMLNEAKELSLILHKFKENQGYIDFEIDEPKIKLNDDGSVKEIVIHKRGFSEVLIEDFMVRANETVAKYLFDNKLPLLYRIHEIPDFEKINALENSLKAIGLTLPDIDLSDINPQLFSQFAAQIKDQRNDDFVKLSFLRTMQKAIYSTDNVGHFGLASNFYCHFTSPIRRYPDLIVHRTIRKYLTNNHSRDDIDSYTSEIESYGVLNTKSEQKAVQIERDVNDLKFAEYLKDKIGQTFDAQIQSILNFGFFISFEFKASGLVHKTSFFDGEYEANETLTSAKVGQNKFNIGDWVKVVVVGVDLVEGKVDCVLESQYPKYLENQSNLKENLRFKHTGAKSGKNKKTS